MFKRNMTIEDIAAFIGAASAAQAAGKKKFKLGDKEYPVTISKDVAKKVREEDVADFIGAASAAKSAGKKKFKFGDKEYPVTISDKVAKAVKEGKMPCVKCEGKGCDMCNDKGHLENAVKDSVEIKKEEMEKVECPECEGKGCDHCDGKGYHEVEKEEYKLDGRTKAFKEKLQKLMYKDQGKKDLSNEKEFDGRQSAFKEKLKKLGYRKEDITTEEIFNKILEERWEVKAGKHAIGSLSYDDKEIVNVDKKTAAKLQAYFKKTKDGKAWREIFQGKGKGKDSVEDQKSFDAYAKRLIGEELEEAKSSTGYELYHKDFSSAMKHAYDFAKKKFGIEIDPEEIDDKVAMGPRKPSSGKTNSYRLMGTDKRGKSRGVQIQVANLDNKRYELNMYKEEVGTMSHEEWDLYQEEVLSEMMVARKDFEKLKKGDKVTVHFDSSMKKGHKETLVVNGKSKSAKYDVEKVSLSSATDSRNRTKFFLYSRKGGDASLAWGDMGVSLTKFVKEELQEAAPKIKGSNPKLKNGIIRSIRGKDGKVYDVELQLDRRGIRFRTLDDMGTINTIDLRQASKIFEDLENLNEKKYSIKQYKMAFGVLNDPRWKGGNMTQIVKTIEKIAKGLSDDPAVSKAIQITNEDLQEGTWAFADKSSEVTALKKLMSKPITLGKEGDDATDALYSLLGDDELFDDLYAAGKRNPKGDARPVIKKWFKQRIKDNAYGMGKDAADLAKKLGLKEEAELFVELKEPFVVVDTADGNKVVGTASDEKGAKSIITTSELPPMKIKDKKTLKIMKSRKKQMIGRPLMAQHCMEEFQLTESIIDDMRDIVDNKQAKKIKGTMVDLFTASAVVQIYDKVNDSNKSKMEKLPLPKLVDLAYKIMKREEINEINTIIENADKKDAKEMEEIVREINPKYSMKEIKKEVEQMAMEKYGNKYRARKIASYVK